MLAEHKAVEAEKEHKHSYKFGGYIKTDVIYSDYGDGSSSGAGRDFYIPGTIPVGGVGESYLDLHAKESRINFKTNHVLDNGAKLGAFVEMDFLLSGQGDERVSNSFAPRLRHAFLTYNNWLFGQTWMTFFNVGALPDLLDFVGGAPVVIKLLEGTQGVGVVLGETRNAAKSVIEAFRGLNANFMVQEFIKEAGGADIRCFVIGEKVVASMKRTGKEGDFRSNLHRGGSAELVRITPEERSTAVRSAKIMGLNVAGVDLLRSNHGPVVMEVNSSPGLEGIETATGKDIAGLVIQFIEKNARPGRTRTRGRG